MYTDARTAIMNDLDDKVPVSMMKQGPSISTNEQVSDSEHRRAFTMAQQCRKGKGKGKGKGRTGTCWNCGESVTPQQRLPA